MRSAALLTFVIASAALVQASENYGGSEDELNIAKDARTAALTAHLASIPILSRPLAKFYGTKKSVEGGSSLVRFSSDSDTSINVDLVTVEDSDFWSWDSKDTSKPCNVNAKPDPCAPAPVCTVSTLHRLDFDVEFYANQGKGTSTDVGNGTTEVVISEFDTEKPKWNVHSFSVKANDNGKLIGTMTTFYPKDSNPQDDKSVHAAQVVFEAEIKKYTRVFPLDVLDNGLVQSEDGTETDSMLYPPNADGTPQYAVVETIVIVDKASQADLFTLDVLKENTDGGNVIQSNVWNVADGAAQSAVFGKLGHAGSDLDSFLDGLQQVEAEPLDASRHSELQAEKDLNNAFGFPPLERKDKIVKDFNGNTYYTDYPNIMVQPNHPNDHGWMGDTTRNRFDGISSDDLNCNSDTSILNWLGTSAIYTHGLALGEKNYAYNDWMTEDNHKALLIDMDLSLTEMQFYSNKWDPSAKNTNALQYKRKVCEGHPTNELECSPVHVSPYGGEKYKYTQREIVCYRTIPDKNYTFWKSWYDGEVAKYKQCPEKNPNKDFKIPFKPAQKEVFIVVSGSLGGAKGPDFASDGGNYDWEWAPSEAPFMPFACFFAPNPNNLGPKTSWDRHCRNLSGRIGTQARSNTGNKLGDYGQSCGSDVTLAHAKKNGQKKNRVSRYDYEFWQAWENDRWMHEIPGGPWAGTLLDTVTEPAKCDPTKVNLLRFHDGVKTESQIHRDRAYDVGIEALYMQRDPVTKELTPYSKITYVGHSRGGAKVQYMGYRHKSLWPEHNVHVVALGSMAAVKHPLFNPQGGHVRFDQFPNKLTGKKTWEWQGDNSSFGTVYENLPKYLVVTQARGCLGPSYEDFAVDKQEMVNFTNKRSVFTNLLQTRMCETVKIARKTSNGFLSGVTDTVWKTYWSTNGLSDTNGAKQIHFVYGSAAYYAHGFDLHGNESSILTKL